MGSSGSGTFSDYSRHKPLKNEDADSGGSSGKDRCGQAFESALEEVSRCFYFMNRNSVPLAGTEVKITFNGLRFAIETTLGEELGYLPTGRNYIKVCIDSGFKYIGAVNSASLKPTPSIRVDIFPEE